MTEKFINVLGALSMARIIVAESYPLYIFFQLHGMVSPPLGGSQNV